MDHLARHPLIADAEIPERALGLRAPVAVRRHLDGAHRIGFRAHSRFVGHRPSPVLMGSWVGQDVTRTGPAVNRFRRRIVERQGWLVRSGGLRPL